MSTRWKYAGLFIVIGSFMLAACAAGQKHRADEPAHEDGYEFVLDDDREVDPDELLTAVSPRSDRDTLEAIPDTADAVSAAENSQDEFLETSDDATSEPLLPDGVGPIVDISEDEDEPEAKEDSND